MAQHAARPKARGGEAAAKYPESPTLGQLCMIQVFGEMSDTIIMAQHKAISVVGDYEA